MKTITALWMVSALLLSAGCAGQSPEDVDSAVDEVATKSDVDRQKQTVNDLRNLGNAWMSWLTDQVGAASAGQDFSYSSAEFRVISYEEVFEMLHPSEEFFYMLEPPQFDGWGHPYEFRIAADLRLQHVLTIRSPGKDGVFEEEDGYGVGPFPATDYDRDLVWADGYFIRWPEHRPQGDQTP